MKNINNYYCIRFCVIEGIEFTTHGFICAEDVAHAIAEAYKGIAGETVNKVRICTGTPITGLKDVFFG